MQMSQLQSDYQSLLDKKLSELQNETSAQMNKSRTVELEVRAQLESRLTQMEQDYISKSKHENILTAEIMELKVKHAQDIKDLEEKYEQEIYIRTKELADKKRVEYEALLSSVKSTNIRNNFFLILTMNQKAPSNLLKKKALSYERS